MRQKSSPRRGRTRKRSSSARAPRSAPSATVPSRTCAPRWPAWSSPRPQRVLGAAIDGKAHQRLIDEALKKVGDNPGAKAEQN